MTALDLRRKIVVTAALNVIKLVILRRRNSSLRRQARIPYFNKSSFNTEKMVREIIESENSERCYLNFRMDGTMFHKLCDILSDSILTTRKMSLVVQVAIYLDWVSHYPTIRTQRERFRLSHDRIVLARRNVQNAVNRNLYTMYVKQATTIPNISGHTKYKYFQGGYGCIDGSHLPIEVRKHEKEKWRNRKGFISTNALLICDIGNELKFQYAMFGAEGPGGDSQVLRYCCTMDLTWVPNGFLIADAGYALSKRMLTPYRGVRYHLKEFHQSSLGRPRNKEELFNLRHASFRNQIERAFGVMKKRFRVCREILVLGKKSDMWKTYYACVAIHNFIRTENSSVDRDIEAEVMYEMQTQEGLARNDTVHFNESENSEAKNWRNELATAMWSDYCINH